MEANPAALPESDGLNIAALSGLFRNTTNSYKFVFFLSLLELLKRHGFDAERPYSYLEITTEMLSAVWFAHTFFKLSFGTQDTITQKLDALGLEFQASENLLAREQAALRQAITAADLKPALRLMDFVPYRLQIPFLESQLRDVDKGAWMVFERAMPAIANRHFESARPLYRYDSDTWKECSAIHWYPDCRLFNFRSQSRKAFMQFSCPVSGLCGGVRALRVRDAYRPTAARQWCAPRPSPRG